MRYTETVYVALVFAAALSLWVGSPNVYVGVSMAVIGLRLQRQPRSWVNSISVIRGVILIGACSWTSQPQLLLPATVIFLSLGGLHDWVTLKHRASFRSNEDEPLEPLDWTVGTVGMLGLACTLVAGQAGSPWLLVAGLLRPVLALLQARYTPTPPARNGAYRIFYGLNLVLMGATPWLEVPWTQLVALWVGLSSIYALSPDFLALSAGYSRFHYLWAPLALNFLLFAPETYFVTSETPTFPWQLVKASQQRPEGPLEFLAAALFDRGGIDPLRVLVEFWLLWLLLVWLARAKPRALRWASHLVAVAYLGFWLLIIYGDVMRHIMGRSIDFVHDADFLIPAYHLLLFNLNVTGLVLLLVGVAAIFGVVFLVAQRALYMSAKEIGPLPRTPLLVLALFALIGTVGPKHGANYVVQSVTRDVWQGVVRARKTYVFRKRDEHIIPQWRASNKPVRLTERPNVVIYIMESYGDLLFEKEKYRDTFSHILSEVEQEIGPDFHVRSFRSRAPVCGSGSWMSATTMMTGLEVADQVRYELIAKDESTGWAQTPSLVQTFNSNGYHTVAVQPGNRLKSVNFFGVRAQVDQRNIEYDGTRYVWGCPPDRYSLLYAHEHYVRTAPKPWFVVFENMMSHQPFLAPSLADERTSIPDPTEPPHPGQGESQHDRGVSDGHLRDLERHYLHSIRYSWHVAVDYIKTLEDEPLLVVVIGDHAPPQVDSCAANSFLVPLHFITNQAALLERLPPGRATLPLSGPPTQEEPPLHHADLKGLIEGMLQPRQPSKATEKAPE